MEDATRLLRIRRIDILFEDPQNRLVTLPQIELIGASDRLFDAERYAREAPGLTG